MSQNTHRFVQKVIADTDITAARIPLRAGDPPLTVREPFILIVPTYGYGDTNKVVPRQVVKFLKDETHRELMKGVIGNGNINFNNAYCLGARQIALYFKVPHLYDFEILGTPEDVDKVQELIQKENKG